MSNKQFLSFIKSPDNLSILLTTLLCFMALFFCMFNMINILITKGPDYYLRLFIMACCLLLNIINSIRIIKLFFKKYNRRKLLLTLEHIRNLLENCTSDEEAIKIMDSYPDVFDEISDEIHNLMANDWKV